MKKSSKSSSILSEKKDRTVQAKNLLIRGNLLYWEGVIIQISNICFLTTTNFNTPRFPLWSILLILAGIAFLSEAETIIVGLLLLLGAVFAIYSWYKEFQDAKGKKYLTILLNSGYTYSILFNDHSFLSKVFHVFANILDEGTSPSINYFIDMVNCKIDNNSSVVAEAGR